MQVSNLITIDCYIKNQLYKQNYLPTLNVFARFGFLKVSPHRGALVPLISISLPCGFPGSKNLPTPKMKIYLCTESIFFACYVRYFLQKLISVQTLRFQVVHGERAVVVSRKEIQLNLPKINRNK